MEYYGSEQTTPLPQNVREFMEIVFSKSIPRKKRRRLSLEYPRPDTPNIKVPKLDTIFKSALGRDKVDKTDEHLAKIQATVLAACSPVANLWSHLDTQGFKGRPGESIPTEDVIRVAKDTLALLGNASCYISRIRRNQFISSMTNQRPAVAKFLRDVTKEGNCGKGSELFGADIHKKMTDRADTIEAFNKAVSKVEGASKQASGSRLESRFLSKRPAAYGDRSGREYTPYRSNASNRGRYTRPHFRGGQGKHPSTNGTGPSNRKQGQ